MKKRGKGISSSNSYCLILSPAKSRVQVNLPDMVRSRIMGFPVEEIRKNTVEEKETGRLRPHTKSDKTITEIKKHFLLTKHNQHLTICNSSGYSTMASTSN